MKDTTMTVVGNLVDTPRMRITKNGHAVANFRVASTSRRFDRENECYVDNATLFMNVTCWRGMAENVEKSFVKGQPVIVTGRVYSREYTVNEVARIAYELEATAVGHDLSRGTSTFAKTSRPYVAAAVEVDANGIPADPSDHWLGLAADATASGEPAEADIRELVTAG